GDGADAGDGHQLGRRASHRRWLRSDQRPGQVCRRTRRYAYVCVPTAASMDGYAASGAALRDGGFKRTFACSAPVAIVADLDVIARAPAAMAAWGYGDLVGKLVAGA